MEQRSLKSRLLIVGALAAATVVLLLSMRVRDKVEDRTLLDEANARPLLQAIDARVDSLLDRYTIQQAWRKSWIVTTPGKKFIRKERRITVPSRFVSLDFNHDLSRELSGVSARLIASERTKESTVSMHIMVDDMIVETLVFVLNRDLE
jgi:hypothetical protein